MGRFQFRPTRIPDIVEVRPERFGDARGHFAELFRSGPFREAGIPTEFVQDNVAGSTRGVLRGLHFQLPPSAQGKLVGALVGEIYDVAVDLRKDSPTYGEWVGVTLRAAEGTLLWIPPGFAHGYQALTGETLVYYKVTAEHDPTRERGIRWDDPQLGIEWPLPVPLLSDRDRKLGGLEQAAKEIPSGPWIE